MLAASLTHLFQRRKCGAFARTLQLVFLCYCKNLERLCVVRIEIEDIAQPANRLVRSTQLAENERSIALEDQVRRVVAGRLVELLQSADQIALLLKLHTCWFSAEAFVSPIDSSYLLATTSLSSFKVRLAFAASPFRP